MRTSTALAGVAASAAIAAGAAASVLGLVPAWAGLVLGIAWLCWNALLLGRLLFPGQGWGSQAALGSLPLAAAVSIGGAACYYLWQWDAIATSVVLLAISAIATFGIFRDAPLFDPATPAEPTTAVRRLAVALLGLLWAAALALVISAALTNATVEPIRSPWAALPSYVPAVFAIATASLALLSLLTRGGWSAALWAIHGVVSLGIVAAVYPLGYGFDPFIHRATEQLLLANGTFSPAPPYYLGQYGLITALTRLLHLPLLQIDRWLVLVIAGLAVPSLGYLTLRRNFKVQPNLAALAAGAGLAIPLAPLIATTPHALSLLFAGAAICAAVFVLEQRRGWLAIILCTLAAIATHPLIGVPLAAVGILVWLWRLGERWRPWRIVFWLAAIVTPLAVPVMFQLNGTLSPANAAALRWPQLSMLFSTAASWLAPRWVTLFDLRDAAYLYLFNLPVAIIIGCVVAIWFLQSRNRLGRFVPLAVAGAATLLGGLLTASAVDFSFLISYERGAFAERLLQLATVAIAPLVLVTAYRVLRRLDQRGVLGSLIAAAAVTVGVSTSFFLTYPTFDDYRKDRGYNTAAVDFDAVRAIEADAKGKPYVVLANQATAAAAVTEFGFGRSYRGNYFYPIPTGGPLYKLYLNYVYDGPTPGVISRVRELTGVPLVYVAISNYWDSADRIIREANVTTPKSFTVAGKSPVVVFRYD